MVSWSSTTGGQRSTETKYRAEKICLHMVARMLQAGWGRSDKLQQEQTSPNYVQRNFSSVRPNFLLEIITLARESKGPLPSCYNPRSKYREQLADFRYIILGISWNCASRGCNLEDVWPHEFLRYEIMLPCICLDVNVCNLSEIWRATLLKKHLSDS